MGLEMGDFLGAVYIVDLGDALGVAGHQVRVVGTESNACERPRRIEGLVLLGFLGSILFLASVFLLGDVLLFVLLGFVLLGFVLLGLVLLGLVLLGLVLLGL